MTRDNTMKRTTIAMSALFTMLCCFVMFSNSAFAAHGENHRLASDIIWGISNILTPSPVQQNVIVTTTPQTPIVVAQPAPIVVPPPRPVYVSSPIYKPIIYTPPPPPPPPRPPMQYRPIRHRPHHQYRPPIPPRGHRHPPPPPKHRGRKGKPRH